MHGHYYPVKSRAIVGPSQANLRSILPFMAHLNLPYLSRLMNDPISHQPNWLPMPTKLALDIPMFEGKVGEDPKNHIMSFHLWFSSNNIVQNSITMSFLQCKLTGVASKWYIELSRSSSPISPNLPPCSSNTFNYPFDMTRELRSFYHAIKIQLPTSKTTSMSGDDDMACVRSNWMT